MFRRLARWRLPFFTCWLLFVNHYSRDVAGALEKEIEAGYGLTKADFGLLNSLYFVPNLFVPLLVGALAQRFGSVPTVAIIQLVAAVGHTLVGFSASLSSVPCLIAGRTVLGLCYESIDIMPLPLLGRDFKESWAFLVGVFNAFLRMGSVMNFLLSPLIYRAYGLPAALWASSVLGLSGLATVLAIAHLARRSRGLEELEEPVQPQQGIGACGGIKELPRQFWLYCATGMFMYSGIVPFWFFGSKYVQELFGYSLEASDFLMLLPEGMIALLSPVIGIHVDRAAWSTRKRLKVLTGSLAFLPASYALLLTKTPPALSVFLLGSGWAWSNCIFWSLSAGIVPEELLAMGSGIIGLSLNVGATLLPLLMARVSDHWGIVLLILVSVAAALAASLTAASGGRT